MTVASATPEIAPHSATIYWRSVNPSTARPQAQQQLAQSMRSVIRQLLATTPKSHTQYRQLLNLAREAQDLQLIQSFLHLVLTPCQGLQVYLSNATLPQSRGRRVQLILRLGGHGLASTGNSRQSLTLVGSLAPLSTATTPSTPCAFEIERVSLTALPVPAANQAQPKLPQELNVTAQFQPAPHHAGAQGSFFTLQTWQALLSKAQYSGNTQQFVNCERILLDLQTQLDNFGVASLRYLAWDYQPRNHSLQFLVVGRNARELAEQAEKFRERSVHLRGLPDERNAPAQLSCGAQGINLSQGIAFAGTGKVHNLKFAPLSSGANLAAQGYMPSLVNLGNEFLGFTDINRLSELRTQLQDHFTQPLDYRYSFTEYTFNERTYDGLLGTIPSKNYAFGILEVPLSDEFKTQHLSDIEFKVDPMTMSKDELIRTSREIMARTDLPFQAVPHAGFLVNMSGQRVPRLVEQERNLQGLWNVAQSSNPYLYTYFGDVAQAKVTAQSAIQSIAPGAFRLPLSIAQQNAVQRIVNAPQVSVITGAPGTGKTRVAAEALLQLAARGKRILLTGANQASVDGVLAQLPASNNMRVLRLSDDQLAHQAPREIRRLVDNRQLTQGVAQSVGASSIQHYYDVQREGVTQRLREQQALEYLQLALDQLEEHGELLHSPAYTQAQQQLKQIQTQQQSLQEEFARRADKLAYTQSRLEQTHRIDHELVRYTSTAPQALLDYWTGVRDNLEDLVIFDNGGHFFEFWRNYAEGSKLGLRNFKQITADHFRNSDVNQRWSMFQQARTQVQAVRQHRTLLDQILSELNPHRHASSYSYGIRDFEHHNPFQVDYGEEEECYDDEDFSLEPEPTPAAPAYGGDPFLGIEMDGARNEDFSSNYGVTGNYAECHADPSQRTLTAPDPFLELEQRNAQSVTGARASQLTGGAQGGDVALYTDLAPAQLVAYRQEQLVDWQRINSAGEFDMELAQAITKEKQRLRRDPSHALPELVANNYRPGSFTIVDGQLELGNSPAETTNQLQQYVQRVDFVVLRNWRDWSLAQLEQHLDELLEQLTAWDQSLHAALGAATGNFGKAQNRYNNEVIAEQQTALHQLTSDIERNKQELVAQQQELVRLQQAEDYLADPQAHFLEQLRIFLNKYKVQVQFTSFAQFQADSRAAQIKEQIRKDAQVLHSPSGKLQGELHTLWGEILADADNLALFATQDWENKLFAQTYTQQAQVIAVPRDQLERITPAQGGFDVVLVDNAQQIPLLELPPLMAQAPQVVLLGDPFQHPAQLAARENPQYTLFSIVDQLYEPHFDKLSDLLQNYNGTQMNQLVQTSWLQQFTDYAPSDLHFTLGQQYRMHPAIAQLVNLGYGEQARNYQELARPVHPAPRAWVNQQGTAVVREGAAVVWVDTSALDLRAGRETMPVSQFSERALVGYCLVELHKQEEASRSAQLEQQLSRAVQTQQHADLKQLRDQLEAQLPRKSVGVLCWNARQLADIQRDIDKFPLSKFDIELLPIDQCAGCEFDIVVVSTVNPQLKDTTLQYQQGMETLMRYEWLHLACSRAREQLLVFAPCVQLLHTKVDVPTSYNFAQPDQVQATQVAIYDKFYTYCTSSPQAQWLSQADLAAYFAQQVADKSQP